MTMPVCDRLSSRRHTGNSLLVPGNSLRRRRNSLLEFPARTKNNRYFMRVYLNFFTRFSLLAGNFAMKAAVIIFPGSNREWDVCAALKRASGHDPIRVWHREAELPAADLIVLPGGFAYGDYLRCGAMAAHSPIMREVKARAARHPGARHLQRVPDPDRSRHAARRPPAQPHAELHLPRCPSARREHPDDLHLRLCRRPDDPGPDRPPRRQLHRRSGDARPAGGPGPRRLPLLQPRGRTDRRGQCQRLGPRHRRHLQRQPHDFGADAAPRKRHRPAAGRHRRPRAFFDGLVSALQ